MPPVDYLDNLVLAATHIKHDLLARQAQVTYAVFDITLDLDAQEWAEFLQTQFADNLKDLIDNNAVITRTTTLLGSATPGEFTVGESTAAGTRGTNAISSVSPNVAVLFKKSTGLGGRSHRGRGYLPWAVSESDVDEIGTIGGGYLATVQSSLNDWLEEFDDAIAPMVIANRIYDLPWDNPNRRLLSVTAGGTVTSLRAEPVVATQRRRLVRQ